jgi:hypothetical protein
MSQRAASPGQPLSSLDADCNVDDAAIDMDSVIKKFFSEEVRGVVCPQILELRYDKDSISCVTGIRCSRGSRNSFFTGSVFGRLPRVRNCSESIFTSDFLIVCLIVEVHIPYYHRGTDRFFNHVVAATMTRPSTRHATWRLWVLESNNIREQCEKYAARNFFAERLAPFLPTGSSVEVVLAGILPSQNLLWETCLKQQQLLVCDRIGICYIYVCANLLLVLFLMGPVCKIASAGGSDVMTHVFGEPMSDIDGVLSVVSDVRREHLSHEECHGFIRWLLGCGRGRGVPENEIRSDSFRHVRKLEECHSLYRQHNPLTPRTPRLGAEALVRAHIQTPV